MSDKKSDALQKPHSSDLDSKLSNYAPMIESFANAFLENQRQANETQLQVAKMQLDAQKHRDEIGKQIRGGLQEFQKHRFNHLFWLLVGLATAIFLFAGGLIFILREANTGILLLTHVGAIVSGLLAGIGMETRRQAARTNQ